MTEKYVRDFLVTPSQKWYTGIVPEDNIREVIEGNNNTLIVGTEQYLPPARKRNIERSTVLVDIEHFRKAQYGIR